MTHITTERLKELICIWSFSDCDTVLVLRELLQRREADRWIPTSEATPESRTWVNGRVVHDGVSRVSPVFGIRLTDGSFRWESEFPVTHWRPLPEFKEMPQGTNRVKWETTLGDGEEVAGIIIAIPPPPPHQGGK